jgi:transcriptional regulator with XRE-family HTH domain
VVPSELIRDTRTRKGLSQRQLALRAGTSQSAIDRIERGIQDVTWGRLRTLMLAMGEEPVLESMALNGRFDPDDLLRSRRRTQDERLAQGMNFNRFAGELSASVPEREAGAGSS